MVVRRCRVYGSRLWMAKEIVGVACSKLYRQEQDDETHGQREIYIVQYTLYNRLHHSTNNDATHRHTQRVITLCLKKMTLVLHTITSMHINRFW